MELGREVRGWGGERGQCRYGFFQSTGNVFCRIGVGGSTFGILVLVLVQNYTDLVQCKVDENE